MRYKYTLKKNDILFIDYIPINKLPKFLRNNNEVDIEISLIRRIYQDEYDDYLSDISYGAGEGLYDMAFILSRPESVVDSRNLIFLRLKGINEDSERMGYLTIEMVRDIFQKLFGY